MNFSSAAVIKYPDLNNLGEKFIVAYMLQSISMGKLQQQELKASKTSHPLSRVQKNCYIHV